MEIQAYNKAVRADIAFDPNVKDGRRTGSPRRAEVQLGQHHRHAVRSLCRHCGITSPFGGLKINTDAVISRDGEPISGLYAAGELVGGIFWLAPGSGLTNGSVFGRIAGKNAALQRS